MDSRSLTRTSRAASLPSYRSLVSQTRHSAGAAKPVAISYGYPVRSTAGEEDTAAFVRNLTVSTGYSTRSLARSSRAFVSNFARSITRVCKAISINGKPLTASKGYARSSNSLEQAISLAKFTYYFTGVDTASSTRVQWSSFGFPNTQPEITDPPLVGYLTGVEIIGIFPRIIINY